MRRIDWYPTIDSTMYAASRLAAEGAPSGTVVGADEQTAGHGRYGRSWHSEPGAGLYFSMILRYPFTPVITLALGLAVHEVIGKLGATPDLRWPNDVLIRGRKVAGILPQLEGDAVIAGIGINVNHTHFPPELANIATSLRIETSREHSREQILHDLPPAIEGFCELLTREGPGPILDLFTQASSYVRGRRVQIDTALTGTTAGLNEGGFLLLVDDAGRQHTIMAGGVRPC